MLRRLTAVDSITFLGEKGERPGHGSRREVLKTAENLPHLLKKKLLTLKIEFDSVATDFHVCKVFPAPSLNQSLFWKS